jgi:hypothetical protein
MEYRVEELLAQVKIAMGKATIEGSSSSVADDDDLQDDGQ